MYKIVFGISPPRNRSTVSIRPFQVRGDFEIYHENILTARNTRDPDQAKVTQGWYYDKPCSYEQVKHKILESAQTRNVFVKELSFTMIEFLQEYPEFFDMQNVYFVLLVRDPGDAAVSYGLKLDYKDEYRNHLKRWMGYEQQYEILNLCRKAKNQFLLVQSEDLCDKPEQTLRDICQYVGIEFQDRMLNWQNLGTNFNGRTEWHETKLEKFIYHWHTHAITSTRFESPTMYKKDAEGHPTFEELPANIREYWREAYQYNLPWYKRTVSQ